jgi:uncharacterized alpha/beta hydrolase family protein
MRNKGNRIIILSIILIGIIITGTFFVKNSRDKEPKKELKKEQNVAANSL